VRRYGSYKVRDNPEIRRLTLSIGGVDTNDILEVTITAGELAVNICRGHVVSASQKINTTAEYAPVRNVACKYTMGTDKLLAIIRTGHSVITEFDAEQSRPNEAEGRTNQLWLNVLCDEIHTYSS
jgi:hypothetical protein